MHHPRILHAPGQVLNGILYAASLFRFRPPAFQILLSSWAYPDGFAAACLSQLWRVPFVLQVLGCDLNRLPEHPGLRPQIAWTLRRARSVLAVSSALAERARQLGASQARVLPRGVDLEAFSPREVEQDRLSLGLDPNLDWLLYVGRLEQEKGIAELLQTFEELELPQVGLAVVGHGSLQDLCQRAQTRLQGRLVMAGPRPHHEMPRWYGAARLVMIPSRREGLPNVLREALSAGRPVVATRVGGIPELLRHPCQGQLVPPGCRQALAEAILKQLQTRPEPQQIRRCSQLLDWRESAALLAAELEAVQAQSPHHC